MKNCQFDNMHVNIHDARSPFTVVLICANRTYPVCVHIPLPRGTTRAAYTSARSRMRRAGTIVILGGGNGSTEDTVKLIYERVIERRSFLLGAGSDKTHARGDCNM